MSISVEILTLRKNMIKLLILMLWGIVPLFCACTSKQIVSNQGRVEYVSGYIRTDKVNEKYKICVKIVSKKHGPEFAQDIVCNMPFLELSNNTWGECKIEKKSSSTILTTTYVNNIPVKIEHGLGYYLKLNIHVITKNELLVTGILLISSCNSEYPITQVYPLSLQCKAGDEIEFFSQNDVVKTMAKQQ